MVAVDTLEKELYNEVYLAEPGLVGCRRRGRWSADERLSWRYLRGNALLSTVGAKEMVTTPLGPLEYYVHYEDGKTYLLQFRGGPWNLDWVQDFYDLWSIIESADTIEHTALSHTILVVNENQGEVSVKEVEVPKTWLPSVRYEKMLSEAASDPPGRISKSGSRAARVCPRCPHKQRCDAEDILQGDTNDWAPSYPKP